MANEYYSNSGTPGTRSSLSSSAIRTEFASISTGLNKLPTLTGNGSKLVKVNAGGTALEVSSLLADSGSGVLIGVTTSRAVGGAARTLQVECASAQASASFMRNSNDAFGGSVVVGKSRGTAVGSNTIVQSGDALGEVVFAGADGTDADTQGALIHAAVDGTPGANDLPTRLVFSTTADGASTVTERMRISSAGVVSITGSLTTTGNATIGDASTDTLTIPLGAAALPSLLPSGATNTGLWFPSTAIVALSGGGVEVLRASSGAVAVTGTLTTTGNVTVGDAAADTLAVQAGSAALPSVIPSGDANTGQWFPAADTIAWSTAGVERARITSAGGVLVAATAALGSERLRVVGDIQQDNANYVRGRLAAGTGTRLFGVNASDALFIGGVDATLSTIIFDVAAGTEAARLTTTGLGIGMIPTNRLDVTHSQNAPGIAQITNADAGAAADARLNVSNGTTVGGLIMRGTGHAQAGDLLLYVNSANDLKFFTNGLERAGFDSAGNFTVAQSAVFSGNVTVGDASTDTLAIQAGSAALPSIIPTGDPNTGQWFPAADTLAWSTGGSERMRVTSAGNVEIGTAGAGTSYRLRVETPGTAGIAIATQISASGNGGAGRSASLLFSAPGSSNAVDVARIDGLHEAVTATATAGAMVFTVANSSGTLTERMRIDSAGVVSITGSMTVSGGITATLTGNASTATALATGRTIAMTGDVTWTSPAFDGTGNVTAAGTLATTGVAASTYRSVTVDTKGRVTAGTNPTTLAGYAISDAYTITAADALLAAKAPLASPTFTGVPLSTTAAVDTNTTQIATTAYVIGQGYAKLAGPTFTGVPVAPTAAGGTNTTQVATTAFVNTAVTGGGLAGAFTTLTTTGNAAIGNASTDTLAVQAGSAALPSIIPSGDLNTGLWAPAADAIGLSTGGTERWRVPSTGQLLVGVTSANANGGVLQLSSGITFPATQVASTDANTLDDYEEGTFTPVLVGTGCTFSFLAQVGFYTKVGRLVTFQLAVQLNSSGNTLAANPLTITGLPFTSSATVGTSRTAPAFWSNTTTAATGMAANIATSSTTLIMKISTAASTTSYTNMIGTDLHATNSTFIEVNGSYFV